MHVDSTLQCLRQDEYSDVNPFNRLMYVLVFHEHV